MLRTQIDYFKSLDLDRLAKEHRDVVEEQLNMVNVLGYELLEGDSEFESAVDEVYNSVRKKLGDSPAQAKAKAKVQIERYKGSSKKLSHKKSGVRTANKIRADIKTIDRAFKDQKPKSKNSSFATISNSGESKLVTQINYFKSLDLDRLSKEHRDVVEEQLNMVNVLGYELLEGDVEFESAVDEVYNSVRKKLGDSPAHTANQNRATSKQNARTPVEEVVELPKTKRTPPSSTKRPTKDKSENKEAMADKKALAAKAKEEAKEAKKKATEAKKKAAKAEKIKAEKVALKGELKTLQGKVKDYAKLEEVLAKSLTNYVKNKFPQGLGATADTDKELEALKMKVKFYRSLLAKDKADYKALCIMLGIDYKISSPKRKASGVAGLGKPKKKKAVSKKEPTFFSKLKNIFS